MKKRTEGYGGSRRNIYRSGAEERNQMGPDGTSGREQEPESDGHDGETLSQRKSGDGMGRFAMQRCTAPGEKCTNDFRGKNVRNSGPTRSIYLMC